MSEPLGRLFTRFLRFGFLAWGGPPAQLAMLRDELVDREQWMSRDQFHRTLAVYQALPGPEAHEMCVHFGMLRRGRWGGIAAGLGFMLPGFVLMLSLSVLYSMGLAATLLAGAFAGFPAAVAALVTRATVRLGEGALISRKLVAIAATAAVATLVGLPFWLVLPLAAAAGLLRHGLVTMVAGLAIGAMIWQPTPAWALVAGDPHVPNLTEVATSGLKAGLLTFGGAYTALPFLERDAVGGGWMPPQTFADGVALLGIIPSPLIMLGAFVGHQALGWTGAAIMTATIFLPAFMFTLIGFTRFEQLVAMPQIRAGLEAITAGVVGLIAVTALGLLAHGVTTPIGLGIFLVGLALLTHWHHRAAVPVLILSGGALGWLFTQMQ